MGDGTTGVRRRALLAAVVAALGGCAYRDRAVVPPVPIGPERLDRRRSAARGRTVGFWTAVPPGHGAGQGLPVCLVLHGRGETARSLPGMYLAAYLSAAVRSGTPPFALAGADGGSQGWRRGGTDDPQRMVHDELPAWCAERGFDVTRRAMWGWSTGGSGVLLLAEAFPGFARAVAAESPAVAPGDDVVDGAGRLRATPVGLWCGRDDPAFPGVRAL